MGSGQLAGAPPACQVVLEDAAGLPTAPDAPAGVQDCGLQARAAVPATCFIGNSASWPQTRPPAGTASAFNLSRDLSAEISSWVQQSVVTPTPGPWCGSPSRAGWRWRWPRGSCLCNSFGVLGSEQARKRCRMCTVHSAEEDDEKQRWFFTVSSRATHGIGDEHKISSTPGPCKEASLERMLARGAARGHCSRGAPSVGLQVAPRAGRKDSLLLGGEGAGCGEWHQPARSGCR